MSVSPAARGGPMNRRLRRAPSTAAASRAARPPPPYLVRGSPTGNNPATGLPWAPATDGLRNITGRVNPGGTVTIWAVTSTVSGGGDQGADPNKLVAVTDKLAAVT